MTELTDIEGVGPSYAETLHEAGYDSAEDVAGADPDELDALVDTVSGDELVARAQSEGDVDDDTDEDPAKTQTYEFSPGLSENQQHHLIAALVEEEIKARRTNDNSRVEVTQDIMAQVRDGEPYNLTLQQLSIAYTGTNQLEGRYRGTRGLSNLIAEIREITQVFQEARKENWPDQE